METWMCQQCLPDHVEVGIVMPGYSLIVKDGRYSLLGGQGHSLRDVVCVFHTKPTADPDPDCSNEVCPAADLWLNNQMAEVARLRVDPELGAAMCAAAREAGWKSGLFAYWLADTVGKLVDKYESGAE